VFFFFLYTKAFNKNICRLAIDNGHFLGNS